MIARIKLSSNDKMGTNSNPSFKINIDLANLSDKAMLYLENFNMLLDETKSNENIQTLTISAQDIMQNYTFDSRTEATTKELFRIPLKREIYDARSQDSIYNVNPLINYNKVININELGVPLKNFQIIQNKILNFELKLLIDETETEIANYIKANTSYNINLLIYDPEFKYY